MSGYNILMNNLLTVRQVAFILKVHPLTIRRYITSGKLKAIKVGGNVRIDEAELQNLNKDVVAHSENPTLIKIKKIVTKTFTPEDPFLRLGGRGASLLTR